MTAPSKLFVNQSLASGFAPSFIRSIMKKFLSGLLLLILIYAQAAAAPPEVRLSSFTAKSFQGGVLIEWRSGFELDNLGYNIYRVKNGQRTLVNSEIIAGSALFAGQGRALYAGRAYVWRDTQGTADALYYLESVDLKGEHKTYGPIATVPGVNDPKLQSSNVLAELGNSGDGGTRGTQKEWSSASLTPQLPQSAQGPLEDQFAIAAQPALKIQVKQDGLYRVTQPELVAAGLDPNVDAPYLRLFADGYEQAMIVKSTDGHLAAGDYIEFYGFGMDTLTTDTRIYYLFRGAVPGKRIVGGGVVRPDATESTNTPTVSSSTSNSSSSQFTPPQTFFWGVPPVFASSSNSAGETQQPTVAEPPQAKEARGQEPVAIEPYREPTAQAPNQEENQNKENQTQAQTQPPTETVAKAQPETAQAQDTSQEQKQVAATTQKPSRKKRVGSRRRRASRRAARKHHNHASVSTVEGTPVFTNKVERKERLVYFSSLLNGDAENFFGQVLVNTPITQTLNVHHLDTTSGGEVRLEVAIQGVTLQDHRVKVLLNNTEVGLLSYGYHEHSVASILLEPGIVINGDNAIKFVNAGVSGDVNIIDYIRITYPHTFTADNNALRFNLRSGQVVKVGGFTTPNIRVFEISDPENVKEIHPLLEQSSGTYSITVEAVDVSVKGRRTFVAIPDTQFNHPAAVVQNQPSFWNASVAGADMLIIAHRNFVQSVAPLAQLRTNQGLVTYTVDVEDVYDEFSYGVHTPQAIKDFLKYATDHWNKKPRYVLLVGDSSLDPRNYFNRGNFDLVPSRLVDTDYTETVSDEVLADFDNDFVAEIPMGRLPARTAAECDLMINKIIGYTPAAVNQSILFVADEQGTYPYSFEEENDLVASLVPPSISKQFVNRSSNPDVNVVRGQLMSGINQGPMIVNYSGHGTLDAWTGSGLFKSPDAYALSNSNHLPFFVTMTCLNGYFEDPAVESISEALLKAPNGGAVAVWSSSGLTVPFGQSLMNKQLYQLLFSDNPPALGDAIKVSKAATPDFDVRKTWVLFGDPSMHLR